MSYSKQTMLEKQNDSESQTDITTKESDKKDNEYKQ
jgi:hypothetical protein